MIWTAGIGAGIALSVLVYKRITRPKYYIQIKGLLDELKDSPLQIQMDPKKYNIFTVAELSEFKKAIQENNKQSKELGYLIFSQTPNDQNLMRFIGRLNEQK